MKTVTLEQVKQAGLLLKREHQERLRLEKVSSDLVFEKRAMQIAFREVELGLSEPFRTYEELQMKVASLLKEDLTVVEKALERGLGTRHRFGELDSPIGKEPNVFENWVLNGVFE